MSIRPIDFHLTYNNTVNEAKNKQIEFNRIQDTNQMAQSRQETEIQRNKERIVQSEESRGKIINEDRSKKDQGMGQGKSGKGKRSPEEQKKNDMVARTESKGLKLDILI